MTLTYAITFALELGLLVVILVGTAIWLGTRLDNYLGTSPRLLLISLGAGGVVIIYSVAYFLRPLINKNKKDHER